MKALAKRAAVCAELIHALESIDEEQAGRLEEHLCMAGRVFCFGMGRSGLCMRGFAMRLMHLGIRCGIVGDTLCEPMQEGDMLVLTSASGRSEILRNLANKAHALGGKVALVTLDVDSPLAEVSDVVVNIHAVSKETMGSNRNSALPMGSLFEEVALIFFDIVISDMMERMGVNNDAMVSRHANLE